ncbi:retrotransposable element Tf2 [Tanacetum coccineum]
MKSKEYGHVLPTPKPVSNVYNKPMTSYPRTSRSNAVVPNTSSRNDTYLPWSQNVVSVTPLEVVIEGAEDAGEEIFEECTNELLTQDSPIGFVQDVNPQISIHTLSGVTSYRTLRKETAKRIGCKMQSICPLKVDVADGNSLTSSFMCKDFKWTLQGLPFVTDMMLTMEFDYGKSKVLLRGTPQTSVQWMQGKGSKKTGSRKSIFGAVLADKKVIPIAYMSKALSQTPVGGHSGVQAYFNPYLYLRLYGVKFQWLSIEDPPKSQGKSVILVVVDRLSKYAHFIPLQHPFNAQQVAQSFLDNIYKLHGLPNNIISDRDKKFWYNTNFHTSIQYNPFEVVYGQKPPVHLPYLAGESSVEVVDRSMLAREQVLSMLKFHLKRAQDRMVSLANKNRNKYRSFDVGTWVFLKLQPHRQVTVRQVKYPASKALSTLGTTPLFPPHIIEQIGRFYKLQLPSHSLIHPVFHISQLKECKGDVNTMGTLPVCDNNGQLSAVPVAILERRLGKVNNKPEVFVLVQWSNRNKEEATWERFDDLMSRFPQFDADNARTLL